MSVVPFVLAAILMTAAQVMMVAALTVPFGLLRLLQGGRERAQRVP